MKTKKEKKETREQKKIRQTTEFAKKFMEKYAETFKKLAYE